MASIPFTSPEEPDSEEDQITVFRRALVKQEIAWRAECVERWPRTRAILEADGAISTGGFSLRRIATCSLQLAQIALTVDKDCEAAKRELEFVLNLKSPTFSELAGLIAECISGRRVWNGAGLELGSDLERVLCFLLLGRIRDLRRDYEAALDERMFHPADQDSARAHLTRQILLCAFEKSELVSFSGYPKMQGLNKSVFFFGYENLVEAIALKDATAFSSSLDYLCKRFERRVRSRRVDTVWGYGLEGGRYCFDILGTALCRLAIAIGMAVCVPSERLYPSALLSSD